jgi:hypothetical protein
VTEDQRVVWTCSLAFLWSLIIAFAFLREEMPLVVPLLVLAFFTVILVLNAWSEIDGDNRRTNQKVRGDSNQRTHAGGAVYTAGPSGTIIAQGTSVTGQSAGKGGLAAIPYQTLTIAQQQAIMSHIARQFSMNQSQQLAVYQNSPSLLPPVVENAGIVLGEIEGYRAWRIFNGLLVSMAVDDVWLPGEPMTATNVREDNASGAHAFKTYQQAVDYVHPYENWAIGRVKLWGQIIEHEIGYRGEFSKPIEIITCQWRKLDGSHGTAEEIARRYRINWRVGYP